MNHLKLKFFVQLLFFMSLSCCVYASELQDLDKAISRGDFETFQDMIENKGIHVNTSINNQPLLSRTIFAEVLKIQEELDESYIKTNIQRMISYLIQHPDTNLNQEDSQGRPPLLYAIRALNVPTIKEMAEQTDRLNLLYIDREGRTIADHVRATKKTIPSCLHEQHLAMCQTLRITDRS